MIPSHPLSSGGPERGDPPGPGPVIRSPAMTSRYTPQDEAEVAGLRASGLTHDEISQRTGIPRRSVTNILNRTPVAEVVTSETRDQVSAALWEVVAAGTKEALRRIADPKTKAGELAQLIKVAADQYALLTGGVTGRTENLNVNADLTSEPFVTQASVRAEVVDLLRLIEGSTDEELEAEEQKALQILGYARSLAAYVPDEEAS